MVNSILAKLAVSTVSYSVEKIPFASVTIGPLDVSFFQIHQQSHQHGSQLLLRVGGHRLLVDLPWQLHGDNRAPLLYRDSQYYRRLVLHLQVERNHLFEHVLAGIFVL